MEVLLEIVTHPIVFGVVLAALAAYIVKRK